MACETAEKRVRSLRVRGGCQRNGRRKRRRRERERGLGMGRWARNEKVGVRQERMGLEMKEWREGEEKKVRDKLG